MGAVGDACDNAMADSFFATLECELIERLSSQPKTEARLALFTCIEGWFDPRRRHPALGFQSPDNFGRNRAQSEHRLNPMHGVSHGAELHGRLRIKSQRVCASGPRPTSSVR